MTTTRRTVLIGSLSGLAGAATGATAYATTQDTARTTPRAVLITGATSGIGRATAVAFARAGDRVFFCGREELGRRSGAPTRSWHRTTRSGGSWLRRRWRPW